MSGAQYNALELDRTIEAVLAAASRVTIAPDGFANPNWNPGFIPNGDHGAASQQQGSSSATANVSRTSVSSQVTPRTPNLSSTRNASHPHHQQLPNVASSTPTSARASGRHVASATAASYNVDDDVDAITSAILMQRHPPVAGYQAPQLLRPSSARDSGTPVAGSHSVGHASGGGASGSRDKNLEGTVMTRDGGGGGLAATVNAPSSQHDGQHQQATVESPTPRKIPAALQRKLEQQQQLLRQQQQQQQNADGSPSKSRGGMRSPDQNAALRANNEFVIRRMELWQHKRDNERLLADYERDHRELDGCTFQPDLEHVRRGVTVSGEGVFTPSSLYYDNHAWGFDNFVKRHESARERRHEKEEHDADAFKVRGPAVERYRAGARTTVLEPFDFVSSNQRRIEQHLMTCGRTNVGGSPGGPSLVASRRGARLVPHQGIRAQHVESVAEERSRIRLEAGPTVPSGAFSQHGAWKDIVHPM